MRVAAIIVGIDGWERYTLPLVESIRQHEPDCRMVVVDNESAVEYPQLAGNVMTVRCNRLCYSAAINFGKSVVGESDWYIVLSNDVLCTGSFIGTLGEYGNEVVGSCLKETHGFQYLEGWCVAIPHVVWGDVGGWDERFLGSDWEDVAFSTAARQHGFWLVEDLPFVHLDQRQRYTIVEDFWGKDAHNRELFMREYAGITA